MTKRSSKSLWSSSFKRLFNKMSSSVTLAGVKAIKQTLATAKPVKPAKSAKVAKIVKPAKPRKPTKPAKPALVASTHWTTGVTVSAAGTRRYHVYRPPGVRSNERLPLIVMLHGCLQDAEAMAASSRMNKLAERKRFCVLYPEQEKLANTHACWNWYDSRSGRAQREARSIHAVIDQLCLTQAIDPQRMAVAGLSAGASMAALLVLSDPRRFRALAMHSGVAPGLAHSSATAVMAMRGRRQLAAPLPADMTLPALLIIQGSRDRVVSPVNATLLARQWAEQSGAQASKPRSVQRGARYPATVTDYRSQGKLVVSLCEINGLDHAWSGGATGHAYSDPKGPDASAMIWAFASKHFI
ncbi:alpha/beta hydrolase family esterase [Undibacterium sp. Di27W]|uniref:extracellular catalytic domain type 1 short-chain-length polyhydroxyalkanoate depolymerase n=1 Tax=Undibacterium sp. Di27W TaxID=3413036 RepID=UPI003BF0B489